MAGRKKKPEGESKSYMLRIRNDGRGTQALGRGRQVKEPRNVNVGRGPELCARQKDHEEKTKPQNTDPRPAILVRIVAAVALLGNNY